MEVTGKPSLWRNSSKESAPRFVSTKTRVLEAWQKVKMRIGKLKVEGHEGARVGLEAVKPSLRTFMDSVSQVWNVLLTCTTLNI